MIYELGKNKDIQKRVQKELDEASDGPDYIEYSVGFNRLTESLLRLG